MKQSWKNLFLMNLLPLLLGVDNLDSYTMFYPQSLISGLNCHDFGSENCSESWYSQLHDHTAQQLSVLHTSIHTHVLPLCRAALTSVEGPGSCVDTSSQASSCSEEDDTRIPDSNHCWPNQTSRVVTWQQVSVNLTVGLFHIYAVDEWISYQ